MQLRLYKPLWGHQGDFRAACRQAVEAGFHGIEGPAPDDAKTQQHYRQLLDDHGLDFIAEICTAGSYVPDRRASVQQHLSDFSQKLTHSLAIKPVHINCLGGCDAWDESRSEQFFIKAIDLAACSNTSVSFETHRGRSLFNPWITARLCRALPSLKITADFSHWCVVCERLLDGELEAFDQLFDRVAHIHARIGFDQGPQVADPRHDVYREALDKHQGWWHGMWKSQHARRQSITTMTPEFGPDGYQAINPQTGKAVGDLWVYNCWIAEQQRQQFQLFSSTLLQHGEPQ